MSKDEHIQLLRAIRLLALLPYPYPDDAPFPPVDPRLQIALSQIAELAHKAIRECETPARSSRRLHNIFCDG